MATRPTPFSLAIRPHTLSYENWAVHLRRKSGLPTITASSFGSLQPWCAWNQNVSRVSRQNDGAGRKSCGSCGTGLSASSFPVDIQLSRNCRYERELNGGSRPALRLISTEDAPATCPMVLCVSNILGWSPARAGSGGQHPELEVTDGWYRMRAKIDLPLARAVRRGLIRVGSKLSVSGAKVSSLYRSPWSPKLT